jgi:hypothetical protein
MQPNAPDRSGGSMLAAGCHAPACHNPAPRATLPPLAARRAPAPRDNTRYTADANAPQVQTLFADSEDGIHISPNPGVPPLGVYVHPAATPKASASVTVTSVNSYRLCHYQDGDDALEHWASVRATVVEELDSAQLLGQAVGGGDSAGDSASGASAGGEGAVGAANRFLGLAVEVLPLPPLPEPHKKR